MQTPPSWSGVGLRLHFRQPPGEAHAHLVLSVTVPSGWTDGRPLTDVLSGACPMQTAALVSLAALCLSCPRAQLQDPSLAGSPPESPGAWGHAGILGVSAWLP